MCDRDWLRVAMFNLKTQELKYQQTLILKKRVIYNKVL